MAKMLGKEDGFKGPADEEMECEFCGSAIDDCECIDEDVEEEAGLV